MPLLPQSVAPRMVRYRLAQSCLSNYHSRCTKQSAACTPDPKLPLHSPTEASTTLVPNQQSLRRSTQFSHPGEELAIGSELPRNHLHMQQSSCAMGSQQLVQVIPFRSRVVSPIGPRRSCVMTPLSRIHETARGPLGWPVASCVATRMPSCCMNSKGDSRSLRWSSIVQSN